MTALKHLRSASPESSDFIESFIRKTLISSCFPASTRQGLRVVSRPNWLGDASGCPASRLTSVDLPLLSIPKKTAKKSRASNSLRDWRRRSRTRSICLAASLFGPTFSRTCLGMRSSNSARSPSNSCISPGYIWDRRCSLVCIISIARTSSCGRAGMPLIPHPGTWRLRQWANLNLLMD